MSRDVERAMHELKLLWKPPPEKERPAATANREAGQGLRDDAHYTVIPQRRVTR